MGTSPPHSSKGDCKLLQAQEYSLKCIPPPWTQKYSLGCIFPLLKPPGAWEGRRMLAVPQDVFLPRTTKNKGTPSAGTSGKCPEAAAMAARAKEGRMGTRDAGKGDYNSQKAARAGDPPLQLSTNPAEQKKDTPGTNPPALPPGAPAGTLAVPGHPSGRCQRGASALPGPAPPGLALRLCLASPFLR